MRHILLSWLNIAANQPYTAGMTKKLAELLLATACLSTACGAAMDDPAPSDAGTTRQCHTVAVDRCATDPTVAYEVSRYESCIDPSVGECLAYCVECAQ